MEISLLRVDNRLIHGQIVQGWLPALDVKEVVVVSEEAAASRIMSKMMRMSLPQEYSLQILGASAAAEHLKQDKALKVLVVAEDIKTLKALIEAGLPLKEVNIGNTKYEEGKKQYSQGVFLSGEELSSLKQIAEKNGISFNLRTLPTSLNTRLF